MTDQSNTINPTTEILSAVGFFRGTEDQHYQYYQVIGSDTSGKQYLMTYALSKFYKDTFEKYLAKFFPIPAPKETKPVIEEPQDGEDNGTNKD